MPKISVILPTYNESNNIQPLVSEILGQLKEDVEVIIVDDTSPDGTGERAQEISQKNNNINVLKREKKSGIASAISDGISMASGDIIAWMDADFSMPPKLLPEMVASLGENDVAVGSRYAPNGADKRMLPIRKFTSKAINLLACFLLNERGHYFGTRKTSGSKIFDYTSGFIATHRYVVDEIPIYGGGGEYCIDFLYNSKLKGFKIVEIPYECLPRGSGYSKIAPDLFSLVRQGFKYCATIFRLRFQRRR